MNCIRIYSAGNTPAIRFASRYLSQHGFEVTAQSAPDVTHLLLPVPSFETDGRIRGGGIPEHILADLPEHITVIGGNLRHPALHGYQTLDLLHDPQYVAQNAALTADCAIRVAGKHLPTVWVDCPVLILGWGRIGKCLAEQLKAMGAKVTVAARKEKDLAMLGAIGYRWENISQLGNGLSHYRVIFNTVPATVLRAEQCRLCDPECIKIELASTPGIEDSNSISALGLPGKIVPESSGSLIAKTVIRLLEKKEY